ncbi:MAG: ABC transporter ATP-binding protein [Planctomycetes bacterium]|nr:ABC transporter ATP-binding protein [Planctomycetota bacterium]
MNSIVTLQGLVKRFGGRSVLDGIDLELPAGTTTVLLGANGAGKSTLLRLLLGLERADEGSIRVAGLDPFHAASEVRRRVGYVPDQPDVYDWMSPKELYGFLAPQYPRWSRELEARLITRLEIPHTTRFSALSRGEAAKAMLVAAIAPQPDLYLFDEAFSGLDPLVRDEVLAAFLEEAVLDSRAALVVTHELDVAARIADRVAVLNEGRIAVCASMEELGGGADSGALPRKLKELLGDVLLEGSAVA